MHDLDRHAAEREALARARYDVVVVGAGPGGLTAAALLARRGLSVLVVERHRVAGGNATVFRRAPGYAFDVGLHYVGSCEAGDAIPRILRAAGADPPVRFNRLGAAAADHATDVFVLPGLTLRVSPSLSGFGAQLEALFPAERRGIRRYLAFLDQVDRLGEAFSQPAMLPLLLPRVTLALRYSNATLARLLDDCTRDLALRALLGGWQAVHALPPSRVAALAHAGATMHYLDAAYFPRGGGQALSDALATSLRQAGGELLLGVEARRIVVADGRARGVVVAERRGSGRGDLLEIPAQAVIANADIQRTLLELVGAEHLARGERRRTERFEWPAALAVLNLGVKRDLPAEGITDATYGVYPELDVEPGYAAVAAGEHYPRPYVCFGVSTLKDSGNTCLAPSGVHNVQLISIAPSDPAAWGVSEAQLRDGSYRRAPAYHQAKQRCGDAMLDQIELLLLPGLRDAVVFRELATPLTHRRYTDSSTGSGYGIALTPGQILLRRPPARTSIRGLYLAGASLRTMHGIVGVLQSGLAAADAVVGGGLQRAVLRGELG